MDREAETPAPVPLAGIHGDNDTPVFTWQSGGPGQGSSWGGQGPAHPAQGGVAARVSRNLSIIIIIIIIKRRSGINPIPPTVIDRD